MMIRRKPEEYDVVDIFVRDDFTREVLKATGKFYQPFTKYITLICFRCWAQEYNLSGISYLNEGSMCVKQFLESQGIDFAQYRMLRSGINIETLKK